MLPKAVDLVRHNEIFDVIMTFFNMKSRTDYDGETPRSFDATDTGHTVRVNISLYLNIK